MENLCLNHDTEKEVSELKDTLISKQEENLSSTSLVYGYENQYRKQWFFSNWGGQRNIFLPVSCAAYGKSPESVLLSIQEFIDPLVIPSVTHTHDPRDWGEKALI